ncbi:MAG: tyrosine-protein kinase Etk/Wzc, partial [Psychromonas sp.]
ELITSKDSLMTFQRRSNLINPESGSDKLGSKAIILQEEMIAIEVEMRLLSDVESQIKSSPNRLDIYRLIPEFTGMRYSTSLSREVEDLHKIMETKEDLLYVVTDNNPEIISINQKIKSKTASILRSIDIVQNRLLKNGRVLRDKLAEVEAAMYKMPEKKMEYSRLKNIQDLNEKYFSMLTEKKVIYGISEAGYSSSNRVLRRAEVADNPVKPNKGKVYSALFAIGTILGVVILFLFYVSFNEISYLDDLKKILPSSMSYLGTIPLAKNETIGFSRLLIAENPKSVLAEALRNIRTNLNFVDNEYKTIAITSSISGEGKTFVALNLAGIIAISGKKVALIDLDLRKPKVHLALGVDNIIGMSTVIIKQSTWQECVQKSEVENLDVITAGPLPPNPSELILSREFSKVISEMEKVYDVIIFDNPPIGIVSDGVSVMTKADVPIYVFKSHFSKRSFTERVIELTEVQKVKKLSIILNGVISTNNSYGYQYAENSDYFEENIKKKSFLKRILGR